MSDRNGRVMGKNIAHHLLQLWLLWLSFVVQTLPILSIVLRPILTKYTVHGIEIEKWVFLRTDSTL